MEKIISQLLTITLKDAEEITALSTQLGYENKMENLLDRAQEVVKSKNDCLFVAKQNGIIVGWIHGFRAIRIESALFVEIAGLVVDRQWQKQNIGENLIEAVKEWSNAMGIKKIRVRCNVTRTESHKFYENIGFSQNKQQKIFEIEI
ncbi:GNAT family N-acetyltransferase [Pedobacter boryungensis]|uniref:GNAT family N-acetyltransferase n=1 Tax=Pedobacter boryungensis TaxID=869962 RepID=A0ABX2DEP1_9SPHI|nr:GNAT family N-acetyltransferase [Pedobacter boryungensis]NQX32563.1 GNAT family N-acetyltransferase [Pedobacter boryungensis]